MTNYKTLSLDLGEHAYTIYIGQGLLTDTKLLSQAIHGPQVLIISNATVAQHYLQCVQQHLSDRQCDTLLLPDGEQHKNLTTLETIFAKLYDERHLRNTTLVALGGGVIGDITGFAASCYQRGVAFIQIPTTLLAQVDSAVGGKTAVNYKAGKNVLGAFYQPKAVISDIATLASLPAREYRSGIAEIIKCALIADSDFFHYLLANVDALLSREPEVLMTAIYRACAIKADIVKADEKEQGLRMVLNLGHTFAHALEAVTGYQRYLHGEAVAIGLMLALRLSEQTHGLDKTLQQDLGDFLSRCQLPTQLPADINRDELLHAMLRDKKNITAHPRVIVLTACGKAVVDATQDLAIVKRVLYDKMGDGN